MQLIVLVLNRSELLHKVLKALYDSGVSGATVIESRGMGRTLSDEIPIFGGLKRLLNGYGPVNETVFSVVEDEKVEEAIKAIESVVGDLHAPGTGVLFTVRVDRAIGLPRRGPELKST